VRKALLIGLIVCVLALGGIGAAFATGLNFNSVGVLASGTATVPPVNVTYFNPGCDNWGKCQEEPMLDRLWLHFDKDLNAGTSIWVCVYNASWLCIGNSDLSLAAKLPAGADYRADFASPIPVKNVYHIRVTVSGP
jgi:hypothetical protein